MVSWPNETSRVRHWPAFSPERQRLAAGLVLFPAGLVVGICTERAAFDWDDPRQWVPDLVVGLTFVGAAVVTVPRYPGSGWLLAATGSVGSSATSMRRCSTFTGVHSSTPWLSSSVCGHRRRFELVAVVVGYLAAVIAPIWRDDATSIVLSLALVAVAAYRFGKATGRARLDRRTAFGAAVVLSVAIVGYVVVTNAVPSGEGVEPMLLAYQVALCVVAVMLAVRLLAPRTAVVADLVVELGETRSGTLRDALSNALGDPTLEIGYWSPSGEYRGCERSIGAPSLPVVANARRRSSNASRGRSPCWSTTRRSSRSRHSSTRWRRRRGCRRPTPPCRPTCRRRSTSSRASRRRLVARGRRGAPSARGPPPRRRRALRGGADRAAAHRARG